MTTPARRILGRSDTTSPEMSVAGPTLEFIENTTDAYLEAYRRLVANGARRIMLHPFGAPARHLAQQIAEPDAGVELFVDADAQVHDVAPGVTRRAPSDADAVLLFATTGDDLSELLIDYAYWTSGALIAPRTDHYFAARPLFLISIPKAGTHLLYELAKAFGYAEGIVCPADPTPATWYCVEFSNSHTVARDFFVDTVRRSTHGNRYHPFMRSPAILIYRNPLDIVVSEARYYHKEEKTAFYSYLSGLTFEERLLRLVDDEWLLGSIRSRIGGFLPWFDVENVAPVSFEELIGPAGGGSPLAQRRAIWSLQLKLHIPGNPAMYADQVFNRESPTFTEGRIGAYRELFTPEAHKRFCALPQDFMELLGYASTPSDPPVTIPARAEEFLRRRLRFSGAPPDEVPIAVDYADHGFNLVRYRGRYFACPTDLGPVDLRVLLEQSQDLVSQRILVADTLAAAKLAIEREFLLGVARDLALDQSAATQAGGDGTPRLVEQGWRGYNIIEYRRRFYVCPQSFGPLDFENADLGALTTAGTIIEAASVSEAKADVLGVELSKQQSAPAERESEADKRGLIEREALHALLKSEQRVIVELEDALDRSKADAARVEAELRLVRDELSATEQLAREAQRLPALERELDIQERAAETLRVDVAANALALEDMSREASARVEALQNAKKTLATYEAHTRVLARDLASARSDYEAFKAAAAQTDAAAALRMRELESLLATRAADLALATGRLNRLSGEASDMREWIDALHKQLAAKAKPASRRGLFWRRKSGASVS